MKGKTVVIVAAHREYPMPADPMYLPLQVGAAGKAAIGMRRDDEGENISELNPGFCEMTGLYWAWKNLDADYIGLAHYRRHFSLRPRNRNKWDAVLKEAEIAPDLGKIRAFVPGKRRYYIETLYSHYANTHDAAKLDETRRIIAQATPEYLEAFDRTMKQRWGYMFNMMILEQSLLDDYCRWVFGILFELKNRAGEEHLTAYQGRYYGRIGEILFNVWLRRQADTGALAPGEIREIPVIHMEKTNWKKKGSAFLRAKFRGKKYSGSF